MMIHDQGAENVYKYLFVSIRSKIFNRFRVCMKQKKNTVKKVGNGPEIDCQEPICIKEI